MKKELQVGDYLFADSRYHGLSLVKVERLTKTTAILDNGSKLDNPCNDHVRAKGDNSSFGGVYYRHYTDKLMVDYKRQNALRKVAKVKWDEVSTDGINKVLNLIIEHPHNI